MKEKNEIQVAERVSPNQMIQLAIESNADLEKLEKVLELSERYEANEARKVFNSEFAIAQSEIGAVIKTKENISRVHSVESFGTHDGPGIRMVVFLQGCKLRCLYCHNPDTIETTGGIDVHIEDLVQKAVHMKDYFGEKGGVTVSGGEPLLQSKELIHFFQRLKEEGIHTNVDTNGRILNHFTMTLLDDYTDLVMLDIKHMTVSIK